MFLDYFVARGHEEVPSASLVPANDPTLLFTNAGMNQFKEVFTGQVERGRGRATSAQKCVRAGGKHNDLENVGRTGRHHTFFEMLGNFSFGDYFKEEAIAFAYELLTRQYGLDPQRLIYTVHQTDEDARALWRKVAGVPDARVVGLGDKDNFWAMGDTGPCGPSSEVHFHQGDHLPCPEVAAGRACLGPACDCDRWVEIWNLVFMQFEQLPDRTRRPLPRPSVDTGMGLERLCAVLGGFLSNYETDLLRPLIDEVARLTGRPFVPTEYGANSASVSMRAIADHARAAAFLIADGVFPEKTGREYVLRRIMRRAIYHGWLLGIRRTFLASLAGRVVDEMRDVYPELQERRSVIWEVVEQEERRFRETLERGLRMLEDETSKLTNGVVPGELAFRLYDTYGFPLDLTRVVAEGRGLAVDEAGFDTKMEEQRRRAEFAGSGEAAVEAVFRSVAERAGATTFLGYDTTEATSEIVALVADGQELSEITGPAAAVAVICRETPFYGEQGGQVGDTGTIRAPSGTFDVSDTRRPVSGLYVHFGGLRSGLLRVGDKVSLSVNAARREAIRRNHSATHLLHWALRHVLGEHVAQKGSLVAPDRLRFDFSHFAPLSPEERQRIEDLVNERVLLNLPVQTEVLAMAEAKKAGAIAFFGEKYGDKVRVLSMGESKELCGGTHVTRTGDVGLFKITEETGIAQGVRRLEAVTGGGALAFVRRLEAALGAASERLKSGLFEVVPKIERIQGELRDKEKEIERLRAKLAAGGGREPAPEAVNGFKLLVQEVEVGDPKTLREAVDKYRDRFNPGIIVFLGAQEGKVAIACGVTKDAQQAFNAGEIVNLLAQDLGGKGGGRRDLAQGGGPLPPGTEPRGLADRWKQKLGEHIRERAGR
jgi:alanyl-tRNA synthetase